MLVIDWDVELGVDFDVTKFEFSLSITELNRLTTFDVDKTVVGILFNDFVVLVCEWAANTLSEDVFSFWKLNFFALLLFDMVFILVLANEEDCCCCCCWDGTSNICLGWILVLVIWCILGIESLVLVVIKLFLAEGS